MTVDTFGTGAIPNIEQRTARGTAATPTATQATDYLARWQGYGYQGGYQLGANLTFNATENWTGTVRGAYISFATTTLGTTTFREAAILANGEQHGSRPWPNHCLVGLSSGKFLAVTESCKVVQRLLEEAR